MSVGASGYDKNIDLCVGIFPRQKGLLLQKDAACGLSETFAAAAGNNHRGNSGAFSTTSQEEHDLTPLKQELLGLGLEGKIVGIMHIINDSLSDVVKSDETRILYGQDYFYETLMGLKFKISTFSFFSA